MNKVGCVCNANTFFGVLDNIARCKIKSTEDSRFLSDIENVHPMRHVHAQDETLKTGFRFRPAIFRDTGP